MNRYKSSTKSKLPQTNVIMFQDDFQQIPDQPVPYVNPRYKSIPSKANLGIEYDTINQQSHPKLNQRQIDQLKITHNQSSQQIKLNNFFGSKKLLERKNQPVNDQTPNPQSRNKRQQSRTKRQFHEEQDPNQKLKKIVQKQIQQRQKWQIKQKQSQLLHLKQKQLLKMKQSELIKLKQHHLDTPLTNQFSQSNISNHPLIINQSQVFSKNPSKQKLDKISSQKFLAINIQKKSILENNNQDHDYVSPVQPAPQQSKIEDSPVMERKKKSTTQLKPLKKKLSTYQVLNQLDLIKKKETSNPEYESPVKSKVNKTRIISSQIQDLLSFNKQHLPKNKFLEGSLQRTRQGVQNRLFPQYRIVIDSSNIIYAKKNIKGYDILLDSSYPNSQSIPKLATVKGNFIGSYYNVYEGAQQKQILATIYYNSNAKSSTRQVQLYVKENHIKYWDLDRDFQNDTSFCSLKSLYNQGDNKPLGKIKKYINKPPYFDKNTGMYKLDFGGKVTILSVKNVVLIDALQPSEKVMVFGKYGHDSFYLKAQSPLSPVVIMGYLMSSFNFKFVTQ